MNDEREKSKRRRFERGLRGMSLLLDNEQIEKGVGRGGRRGERSRIRTMINATLNTLTDNVTTSLSREVLVLTFN